MAPKPWLLLAFLLFLSCTKEDDFAPQAFYSNSGIWEIEKAEYRFLNSSGHSDSMQTFTNAGFFIFYNMELTRQAFLGQRVVEAGLLTKKEGIWWKPEGDKILMGTNVEYHIPDREYYFEKTGKGEGVFSTIITDHPAFTGNVKETLFVNEKKY